MRCDLKTIPALALAFAAGLLWAQGPSDADLDLFNRQRTTPSAPSRAPNVDPKKIINDSNGFLKEREPEMNTEEYALYQKVATVIAGNPQFAITLLEGMMNEKQAPSPAFEFILGNAYYAAGQNQKAEAHYRAAVDRYPTFLRAWSNFGVFYYSTERYADAVTCFSRAVSLGDRDPTTFGLLGYSLEKTGNMVSAEMAYLQALGGAPNSTDWQEGLLRIYTVDRQYGRAESLARSLIKAKPGETRYWLAYANVLLSQQKKLKAIAVLEVAVESHVAGADEFGLLGDLYAEQHLATEAAAAYQRLLAVQPAQGSHKLLQLAEVLISAGKTVEAGEVLARMPPAGQPEDRTLVLQLRADLLAAQKKWPEARAVLDELLRTEPMNGRALVALGASYAAENDPDRAMIAFEAAARVPATTYRATLELANLELKNRHYTKSVEYLEKALRLEKSEPVADLLARVRTLLGTDS